MIRPLHLAAGIASVAVAAPHSAFPQEEMRVGVSADVVSFRSAQSHMLPRVDVYVSVPYNLLKFTEREGVSVAEYRLRIEIRDSSGKTYIDSTYTKSVVENSTDYIKGTSAAADNTLKRFTLAPHSYVVDITVTDALGQRKFQLTKKHQLPDYDEDLPSLSSVLFLRDIEQRGSRYNVVPYIGDVVWSNDQRLFAFFELYAAPSTQHVAFSWQLLSEDLRVGASGTTEPTQVRQTTSQHFFPVIIPQRLLPGSYTLLVRAHNARADGTVDTNSMLASTQHTYQVPRTVSNDILVDLRSSIKKLLYVAGQDSIDSMLAAKSDGERLSMFEDFWRGLDPTPATAANEALDEYYQRIKIANERFRSYNEGWLTDMGRVFIIYGEPLTIERRLGPNRISVYAYWTYGNGLVVTFEDPSGFGDFRLRSSLPGSRKYEYNRRTP